MSTNKTENYHLHAWELGDDFLLSEINENFDLVDGALRSETAKLETALNGRYVVGWYQGDGQASRVISVGFTPKAVLVQCNNGHLNNSGYTYSGFAVEGSPMGPRYVLEIVEGGFQVYAYAGQGSTTSAPGMTNGNNLSYNYIAIR